MRRYHRLALAAMAVGWYLMVPPSDRLGLNFQAPLSKWVIQDSFDTASDCQAEKMAAFQYLRQPNSRATDLTKLLVQGSCIATDDPRLAPQNQR